MRSTYHNAQKSAMQIRLHGLAWMVVASLLLNACVASPVYFIPPTAPATPSSELSFLFTTPPASQSENLPESQPVERSQPTAAPAQSQPPKPATPSAEALSKMPILYYTQAADTLPVVAVRFGVDPSEITSPDPIPAEALLPPNQLLLIPRRLFNTTSSQRLLPDSELVYSPSAVDFKIDEFVNQAGGYLSVYNEWLQSTGTTSGAAVIQRVAIENSINPRLLLALLEYQSGWVYGQPPSSIARDYPMGYIDLNAKGLYKQLVWAVNHLSVGYYYWREGRLLELRFPDGISARLAPDQNAGSVALQYYFAKIYDSQRWVEALNLESGFPALYERMFGNPWVRAQTVEPLYPPGLVQPQLVLPFEKNRLWSFTGGPHGAWEHEGSYAAIDFAPASDTPGCTETYAWVTASASGLVVRSERGLVVLDLDGDGHEQTGWVLLYLHVSVKGSIPVGSWVDTGDPLGHPSCEGGQATGTHVHFARKYNGEWIAADGPMPFVLSGWRVYSGEAAYQGKMTRGDQVVEACTCGSFNTRIMRTDEDPY
jgi:murein DD-endopeptidase MepM/ murein hydrolase activator NlpD